MLLERRLRRFFRQWYRAHGREFPWRAPGLSAFAILTAEMLLRQTRADMVASIWPICIERYLSPESCLDSPDTELYLLLSPLGFGNQRVTAIKSVATALVENHAGAVPRSIDQLLVLPHIGLYSAHAIACFAYNRRVPVVDVNVLRLFSRITGENYGLDNRRGKAPEAWKLARRILPDRNVKEHNYGVLDFCAQICTTRHPRHNQCDLAPWCAYFQSRVDR